MGASLEEVRAAKAEVAGRLAGNPLVNGIGITRTGEGWAVLVNVAEPPSDELGLPDRIDGVEVRVETIGSISAR